jgi:hypothetical protein
MIIMSVKYQITLPDDLAAELKRTAQTLKIPLAQFIRETMEERLRASRKRRNANSKHPLAAIIGIATSDERDLAARVDEILYK